MFEELQNVCEPSVEVKQEECGGGKVGELVWG